MGKGPRNYSQVTIKRLFSLSGNQCAFPDCMINFTSSTNTTNLSNICHIEGAEPGGERYNPDMTDKQRSGYDNLILLCANHHIETNDEEVYTVSKLKEIKKEHESTIRRKIGTAEILNKYPSSLATVINHISSVDLDEIDNLENTHTFSPDKKIEYNQVIRFKQTLKEYKIFHGKLNKIYSEIEKQGSFKKEILLQNIQKLYLDSKGEILGVDDSIENIRSNADKLIERVESKLWDLFEKSPNADNDLPFEAINISMNVVVVDAFIRCKILEEPK